MMLNDKDLEQSALAMLMEMNTLKQDTLAETLGEKINDRTAMNRKTNTTPTPELIHANAIVQLEISMSCWVAKQAEAGRFEVREREGNIFFGIELDDGDVLMSPLAPFVYKAYMLIQEAAVKASQLPGETRSWQIIMLLMVQMLGPDGVLDDLTGNTVVDCLKEGFENMRAGNVNQPVYH
ncbi:hypothetical protein ACAH71_004604 [Escherichia coli]